LPAVETPVQLGGLCAGEGAAFDNGLLKIELAREIHQIEAKAA
jgi:hypothetical protein